MRATLGRTAATLLAATAILVGASSVGAGSPSTTSTSAPTTTSTTTSTTTTSTTSTTTSTTTTSTTTTSTTTTSSTSTTTVPAPPAIADVGSAQPERGSQRQVAPTYPPPTTTTTLPPGWELPAASGTGRRVVYSKSRQKVWAVEADGTVAKYHRVSGRLTWNMPLPGTYTVWSRSAYTCAIQNPDICWRYMVRFAWGPQGGNIGLHEIPTDLSTGYRLQSDSQLGLALSGGCVRQSTSDAIWMWNWAPLGTKVVVV